MILKHFLCWKKIFGSFKFDIFKAIKCFLDKRLTAIVF